MRPNVGPLARLPGGARRREVIGVEHKHLHDELRPNQVAMRAALAPVLSVVVIRTGRPASDGGRILYRENRDVWET